MSTSQESYLLLLARYHHWAYQILYQTINRLSDTDYKKEQGLLFGSVHRTLNHVLISEKVWFGRLVGQPFVVERLDDELEPNRDRLELAMLDQAEAWLQLLRHRDPQRYAERISYTSARGSARSIEFGAAALHVFNNGTHQRAQLAGALGRSGQSAPVLDMVRYLQES